MAVVLRLDSDLSAVIIDEVDIFQMRIIAVEAEKIIINGKAVER